MAICEPTPLGCDVAAILDHNAFAMTILARAIRRARHAYNPRMERGLLGGLTPAAFLRRHWQKRPLLVRGALARAPRVDFRTLSRLSVRDDVESRMVRRRGGRWQLEHGPFAPGTLSRLPARDWTLLVQGLNHHLPEAESLMRRFAFIPQARFDDVMASYAVAGGGVGPHWDAYDVFLVQAVGRRVWRLCRPAPPGAPFAELPDSALRIIDGFVAEDEYLLEPGDLLYLPPGWGHDGIALGPCVTLSVGFRTPDRAELASAFLEHLAEREHAPLRYRDPALRPTRRPARIDSSMQQKVGAMLRAARWTRRAEEAFLGEWLTMPKAHVVFSPPRRPLSATAFAAKLARARLVLDPKTQLLYDARALYLNGEAMPGAFPALHRLADARELPGSALRGARARELAYDWYRCGFLHLA